MDHVSDPRAANLLGALVVGLNDVLSTAMVEASALEATDVSALLLVQAHPGLSITELAAALQLTHSGAVRSVGRLADRQLARRAPGRDQRTRGLYLSDPGRQLAEDILTARRQALDTVLDTVLRGASAAERSALVRTLELLLATLPRTRADAWRICRTCEHAVCRGPDCPVGSAVGAPHPARPCKEPE